MICGSVDSEGIPYVSKTVGTREWKAVVDTGFNGDLELPLDLFTECHPRYFGRALSALAGNQTIEEDHYIVEFPFDGSVVRPLATFVQADGVLLGTNMLRDYCLSIDFPSSVVTVERAG